MGWEMPNMDFAAGKAQLASEIARVTGATAAADAAAAKAASDATKAANQAKWDLNHPVRTAFAGDTIMTLGTDSVYAKKKLLGE